MVKKTITYTDYNGVEITEDFRFNLTKAELMEMELGVSGGMQEKLKKIIGTKDHSRIIALFKEIIMKSYGEMSDDGKEFRKNDEIRERFMAKEAYSDLFMELATNDEAAAAFINGIVPQIVDG